MADGGVYRGPYTYAERAARYRASDGRFLPRSYVRGVLDAAQATSEQHMVALTQQLRAGTLTLANWERGMRQEVAAIHTAAAGIARGGQAQMSPAEWGRVGADVKTHYAHLHQFAQQIADGRQPVDGTAEARTRLYARGSTATFSAVQRRLAAQHGAAQERNQLGGTDSCRQCLSETARGWVAMGTLTTPGTRLCLGNCHCRLAHRSSTDAEAEAVL